MSHPFDNPALSKPLAEVVNTFKTKPAFVVQGAKLLFVCGGAIDSATPTVRQQFLLWAKTGMPNCKVFLAEQAAQDMFFDEEPSPFNLADFEDFLGSVADCVIVFPESVGSFAETGYFSATDGVRRNCLIVNWEQGNSFLNRGPIDLIERHSGYKRIVLDFNAKPPDFAPIKERLELKPHKKRSGVSMDSFNDLKGVKQLAVLLYLISLFPSLDLEGMKRIFQPVFGTGHWEIQRVKRLLSILVAAQYINRLVTDNDYYSIGASVSPLLEIDGADPEKLRLEHLGIYSRLFKYLVPA